MSNSLSSRLARQSRPSCLWRISVRWAAATRSVLEPIRRVVPSQTFVQAVLLLIALTSGTWAQTSTSVPCREAVLGSLAYTTGFGRCVSISGDQLAVGGNCANCGTPNPGGVFVFSRAGGVWSETAALSLPPGYPGGSFGRAVSLDDRTLAVGCAVDSSNVALGGSCFVYVRIGATWTYQSTLFASDAASGDLFGMSVGLSGDTLMVGASSDDDMGTDSGSVYVFNRIGGSWVQQAKLLASDGTAGDGFFRVALEGDTAVIGAILDDDLGTDSGSAYVFQRIGATWSQRAKLLANDGQAGDWFGGSVAIDHGAVLVGATRLYSTGRSEGYYYLQNGPNWVLDTHLIPGPYLHGGSNSLTPVALHGNFAVITLANWSTLTQYSNPEPGAAVVFERLGTNWVETATLTRDPIQSLVYFGTSVAIADDTVVVSAIGDSGLPAPFIGGGSATVYVLRDAPQIYCTAKVNSLSCIPEIGVRNLPSASAISGFQVYCTQVLNNQVGLLLYGTSGRLNLPFQGGILCVSPPLHRSTPVNSYGAPSPAHDCTGLYSIDMSSFAAGLLGGLPQPDLLFSGAVVQCQWWGRDQGFTAPFNTTLSDAVEYTVCP